MQDKEDKFLQPNSTAIAAPKPLWEQERLRKWVGPCFSCLPRLCLQWQEDFQMPTGTLTNALLSKEKQKTKSIGK